MWELVVDTTLLEVHLCKGINTIFRYVGKCKILPSQEFLGASYSVSLHPWCLFIYFLFSLILRSEMVYWLCRGIHHEPVRPRQLPQSVGCSKNFTGKMKLKTNAEVRFKFYERFFYWLVIN